MAFSHCHKRSKKSCQRMPNCKRTRSGKRPSYCRIKKNSRRRRS